MLFFVVFIVFVFVVVVVAVVIGGGGGDSGNAFDGDSGADKCGNGRGGASSKDVSYCCFGDSNDNTIVVMVMAMVFSGNGSVYSGGDGGGN